MKGERLIVDHTTGAMPEARAKKEAARVERLMRASKACALEGADLREERERISSGPGCVQGIPVWLRDALRANTRRALVMERALELARGRAPQPEPCRDSDDDEVAGAREDAWEVHYAARKASKTSVILP